jgi:dTDP-4-dehydrorhamnose reductase
LKILLLGKGGQVGWELQRSLAPLGELVALATADADFDRPDTLRPVLAAARPEVIVNAAAYTAVDQAESEPDKAWRINAESVGVLAEEARALGALLVHFSTDYVFDGAKATPYVEDDATRPLSVYGRTKLEGEQRIRASGARHLVFRTSWVYSARGTNFARTILRLAREREVLSVVDDQLGAPTSAELVADVTALAIHRLRARAGCAVPDHGIYHLAASGRTSWHGFAAHVLQLVAARGIGLRLAPENLRAIPSAQYPLPAVRPRNSTLDTRKLADAYGLYLPDWRNHLERTMDEIIARGEQP